MAAREEVTTGQRNNEASIRSKISGGPLLKQPTFDLSSADIYAKLKNFRMEMNNMFPTII